jgi:coenzyme F420-dependent glucose-6-phosphate dehydrogenase
MQLGYSLSCEEFSPEQLVNFAQKAEESGFAFAMISDHFHPWVEDQPHSPFVWNVIGAISQTVKNLTLGTGVTCPTIRYNPALIAQAAATSACMMPGRFILGLGTGENLNEHILGTHWPIPSQRLEMLEEAIAVIRLLWEGGWQSHHGKYFTVEQARIFTLPKMRPPIMVAAAHPQAAELAGRVADGIITTKPSEDLIKQFKTAGGKGKPSYGQLTVCYAPDEDEARRTVQKCWPNAGIDAPLTTDLALPQHFEKVVEVMQPDQIVDSVVLGPEPQKHIDAINKYIDAGFDHVYVHQIGPKQEEFFHFYTETVLPRFGSDGRVAPASSMAAANP